jgi:hypothetical protein
MARNEDSNDSQQNQPAHGSRHKVRCVDFELGFSNNNNPQVGLGIEIVDGPFAGQYFPTYLSFSDNAAEYSIQKMRALGWKGNDFTQLDSVKDDIAMASFEHEEDDQGENRVRIGWINKLGVAMKNKMSSADVQAFNKRMSALAQRVGGGEGNEADRKLPQRGQQQTGQQQGKASGGYDYRNEAPPPSDDDAPYNRGGNSRGGNSRGGNGRTGRW